jgi:hypothetical protein
VDNQAITEMTGWRPSIGLQQGLEMLDKAEI